MLISFTIPVWLVWIVGIFAGLVVIAFAIIGMFFFWQFKDGLF